MVPRKMNLLSIGQWKDGAEAGVERQFSDERIELMKQESLGYYCVCI